MRLRRPPKSLPVKAHRSARLGWRPDLPDARDHVLTLARTATKLPAAVDLRTKGWLPPVWDQKSLSSCTAHGIGALVSYVIKSETGVTVMPCRLFIYYNERVIENTVDSDAGAAIRDGIKVCAKIGTPDESLWPYSDDGSKFKRRPPKTTYDSANKHTALAYQAVPRSKVRDAVAAGHPVVFGFSVYENFYDVEKAAGFLAPLPSGSLEGGHCTLIVGYDDKRKAFLVRNSWGADWCDGGHFWLPYEFVSNPDLSSDFWTITREGAAA